MLIDDKTIASKDVMNKYNQCRFNENCDTRKGV